MIWPSRAVPSVVTTMAWVSPRVNSAEPWVRGSTPTLEDRAHGVERTAVDADLGRQHRAAHGLVLELAELLGDFGRVPAVGFDLLGQARDHVLLQHRAGVLALELVAHGEGLVQAIANGGLERGDHVGVGGRGGPGPLRLRSDEHTHIDRVDPAL